MRSDIAIAGVGFRVRCDAGPVLPIAGAAYEQFATSLAPGSSDIQVLLDLTGKPGARPRGKLFDSGNWVLYADEAGYRLELGETVASWDRAVKSVTIYCGEEWRRERVGPAGVAHPLGYPLDQLLLMHHLASRQGVLLHAAGAEIRGQGLIFPGRSGSGKTTLSANLVHHQAIRLLSDDRMVVRKLGGTFWSFGTPWPGDAGVAVNRGAPLAAICFISHAPRNGITRLSPRAAAERLLPAASIPWYDPAILPDVLDSCEELVAAVPAYELAFAPTPDVAAFLDSFVP